MRLLPLASSLIFALCTFAHASTITGSGGGFSGSGTLTVISNGDGSSTINAISGPASGVDYLLSPGAFHGNDNQLYPGAAAIVDAHGFAFQDTQGSTIYMVDIFQDGSSSTGYTAAFLDSDNSPGSVDVTLSLAAASTNIARALSAGGQVNTYNFSFAPALAAPAPEPSTLTLLGSGLLGVVAAMRRRLRIQAHKAR